MPGILLSVISILLLAVLATGVIVLFREIRKRKEYEHRIGSLEEQLTASNTKLAKQTESQKTQETSSDFEKFAGLAISHMDRGVIMISQNRTIVYLNEYAKKFMDLAAAVGAPYKEVMHIHVAGVLDDFALFDAAFEGRPQQISGGVELKNQHGTFPVSGTILPLLAGQTVEAIAFIFKDDTEEVARVKEEQAFFSAAAHELRTPLTIIRMTVSLLREKFESLPKEKILEHLRRTDETTVRLAELVDEFLNISRIDQGRLEIKTERFDMVTLTDEVIGNLAMLAKERKLYIHHELSGSERMVVADPAKSAEVLSNLISNGLKYTIQGGLTITHTITDGAFVTTVTDTGTGIQRESQSLLFKRFGQIGEARALVPAKSTGLGLYLSKKLAELMRGDVVLVKSEPGTGSTFAFTLPLG